MQNPTGTQAGKRESEQSANAFSFNFQNHDTVTFGHNLPLKQTSLRFGTTPDLPHPLDSEFKKILEPYFSHATNEVVRDFKKALDDIFFYTAPDDREISGATVSGSQSFHIYPGPDNDIYIRIGNPPSLLRFYYLRSEKDAPETLEIANAQLTDYKFSNDELRAFRQNHPEIIQSLLTGIQKKVSSKNLTFSTQVSHLYTELQNEISQAKDAYFSPAGTGIVLSWNDTSNGYVGPVANDPKNSQRMDIGTIRRVYNNIPETYTEDDLRKLVVIRWTPAENLKKADIDREVEVLIDSTDPTKIFLKKNFIANEVSEVSKINKVIYAAREVALETNSSQKEVDELYQSIYKLHIGLQLLRQKGFEERENATQIVNSAQQILEGQQKQLNELKLDRKRLKDIYDPPPPPPPPTLLERWFGGAKKQKKQPVQPQKSEQQIQEDLAKWRVYEGDLNGQETRMDGEIRTMTTRINRFREIRDGISAACSEQLVTKEEQAIEHLQEASEYQNIIRLNLAKFPRTPQEVGDYSAEILNARDAIRLIDQKLKEDLAEANALIEGFRNSLKLMNDIYKPMQEAGYTKYRPVESGAPEETVMPQTAGSENGDDKLLSELLDKIS